MILNIQQPYAELIGRRLTRYKAVDHPNEYRGPVIIFASKRVDREAFENPLIRVEINNTLISDLDELPTSCVLATGLLTGCHRITKAFLADMKSKQRLMDDYQIGGYALEFTEVHMLPEPIYDNSEERAL